MITIYDNDGMANRVSTSALYYVIFEDGTANCCGKCLAAELRQDADGVFEYTIEKDKDHNDCDLH